VAQRVVRGSRCPRLLAPYEQERLVARVSERMNAFREQGSRSRAVAASQAGAWELLRQRLPSGNVSPCFV
jgi:hypothetical protein